MAECIFCAIVAGVAPARRVAETDDALAFLDIAPLTPGHTLVVPKRHADDLVAGSAEDLAAAVTLAREVAPRVMAALDVPAFHLMVNTGAEALQTVFHTHVHVIPRRRGDGFDVDLSRRGATVEQLDEVHARILTAS